MRKIMYSKKDEKIRVFFGEKLRGRIIEKRELTKLSPYMFEYHSTRSAYAVWSNCTSPMIHQCTC